MPLLKLLVVVVVVLLLCAIKSILIDSKPCKGFSRFRSGLPFFSPSLGALGLHSLHKAMQVLSSPENHTGELNFHLTELTNQLSYCHLDYCYVSATNSGCSLLHMTPRSTVSAIELNWN